MRVRATKFWLAWLLPLFVLRAFIPAGFMLSWADGALQIVLCSGSGPVAPLQMASAHHAEHHGHPSHEAHVDHAHHDHDAHAASQHDHHSNSALHEASNCPFAIAGSASAPAPTLTFVSIVSAPQDIDFITLPELRSTPILIDRIRGPPRV